jgi:uracil-DNA glycosylase family 4
MLVQGEGSLTSKLWLVGEAPGAQEDLQGRPFVGGAGMVLSSILTQAGIARAECYIDNVMQLRPKNNDFGEFYEDAGKKKPKQELLEGRQRIKTLVEMHRPNVVVALGGEALMALTGRHGITKLRGSILGCGGVKVIPLIHPAMVMRQYEFFPICVMDMQRVRQEALTPQFPDLGKDNFITNPSYDKVLDQLKLLKKEKYICFDIETLANQITCIGFGWSKNDALCIPIFYAGNSWWTTEQEIAIILGIKELFQTTSVNFIAQNATYDMVYIKDKWGAEPKNLWMDTMVAFHCVYPELPKGLDFLCSVFTRRPYYKDMFHEQKGPDTLWHYNCLDNVVTWECAMEIRKEMEEYGTLKFYETNSHALLKPLIHIQRQGVKIDVARRSSLDIDLSKSEIEMQEKLNKAVGHELNVLSGTQMKKFLYEELNLPKQIKRSTGSVTADVDAIEKLAKQFPNPAFSLILDIRHVRKLLSNYVRATLDADNRMRCSYLITGTVTGRLSSRESVYGTGTNLQNIDRSDLIRSMFIPDEGKVFVNADLSQAEARVVAALAHETRLRSIFEEGGDIHKRNASVIFTKPTAMVSDGERQLAKTLVHAANYGIGVRKFAQTIQSSEDRARELLNLYHANYPRIRQWHIEVEDILRRTKTLTTPLGRKRTFFGRWSQDLIREAIAYVPQSTVSDILNLGIIRAFPNLPQGWEIVMQVHDSILMQVPKETDHLHIKKFIHHYFEFPFEVNREMLTIPVDIKVGASWGCLKKMEV